jgi:hypothetical protein
MPDPYVLRKYPEIEEYLDSTDDYELTANEIKQGNDRFLVVTQKSIDGQQLFFKWNGESFDYWDNDTFLDSAASLPSFNFSLSPQGAHTLSGMGCGPSSDGDHKTVHDRAVAQVGQFSSASGPDHGNLACVWAVRHIVKAALNRWITQTDGTAVFGPELLSCFGNSADEADVPPGGIVISPTQNIPGSKKRNVGHVGILGATSGGDRLIYSNSSAHAMWEQNFKLSTWIARYRDTKHLKVMFFPLPLKTVGPVA